MGKNKKGFTISELLIVVAIIAVLVAISIPIFRSQLEKSRRTVDIANARSIESALSTMINDGTVELPNGTGVWVHVQCANKQIRSNPYNLNNSSEKSKFFVGADKDAIINGHKKTAAYNVQEEYLASVIESCFGKGGIKSYCSNPDMKINDVGGWDWYIVEIYRDSNGRLYQKIYSGLQDSGDFGVFHYLNTATNIEKYMKQ